MNEDNIFVSIGWSEDELNNLKHFGVKRFDHVSEAIEFKAKLTKLLQMYGSSI